MALLTVLVREVHITAYQVEAKDAADAIEKVQGGEVDTVDNSTEYSHALDSDLWTVEDEFGKELRGTQ